MKEREWTDEENAAEAARPVSRAMGLTTPQMWLVDRDGCLVAAISPLETALWCRHRDYQVVDATTAASLRDYHAAVAELAGIVPG